MRALLVAIVAIALTPPFAAVASIAAALGVPERPGGIYWWIPRAWTRALLWAGGVTVRVHGAERMGTGREPRIFASNHVSWYDVFVLAATLPRYAFVAKAELLRIPVFGAGARAVGTVPIERDNRKSAFASYEAAAEQVRGGRPIIVFPEGTRGRAYPLRPFKKGPFVLAIAAQVPVFPAVVYGTMAIMPKGAWRIRPGTVDLHFLDPVPTAGLTYDDRDVLSATVHARMAELLEREYGVRPAVDADAPGQPHVAPEVTPQVAPSGSTAPDLRV
jgi:1-acyl-sn-glycerol-3-phosphate acyltransferase